MSEQFSAPHPVLQSASFVMAFSGEGAAAYVVHGGWEAMLLRFVQETMSYDATALPEPGSAHADEWALWLDDFNDLDGWSGDESNQPYCFNCEVREITRVAIYRLAAPSLPPPLGEADKKEKDAQAAYEAATAWDRKAPGGAMTWAELSEATKQEWRRASAAHPVTLPIAGGESETGHGRWHDLNSAADAVLRSDWDDVYCQKLAAWLRALANATVAAAPAAAVQPTGWEYGWLVENGKQQGSGLAYRFIDNEAGGIPAWTDDPNKALRFARRDDAEQFCHHDEDAWRIVEHGFCNAACSFPDCSCTSDSEGDVHCRLIGRAAAPTTGAVQPTEENGK